jgi:hypothetical protein
MASTPGGSEKLANTGYASPSNDIVKVESAASTKDADAALDFLRTNITDGEAAQVDERALVRKIDWMIMPLMWACYFLRRSSSLGNHLPATVRHHCHIGTDSALQSILTKL